MSITHQKWDAALDGAQVYEPNERERLRRALDLAADLLAEFPGELNWAVAAFREYSRKERRLPLLVESPLGAGEEGYDLEWDLAQRVLGPVYKATRVSMPVTVSAPGPGPTVLPAGPGLLYPPAPR